MIIRQMKIALLLFLLMAGLAPSQLIQPVQITGPCSSGNTGNPTNFNVTCSGLAPSQVKLLENIPTFINRLLSSQTDKNTDILLRLVSCLIGTSGPAFPNQEQKTGQVDGSGKSEVIETGPRSISADQKQKIVAALHNPPGKPELRISVAGHTAESTLYARQLYDVFSVVPGWTVQPIQSLATETAAPTGLIANVQTDSNVYGFALRRLFTELGIKIKFAVDGALGPELVVLVVGQISASTGK